MHKILNILRDKFYALIGVKRTNIIKRFITNRKKETKKILEENKEYKNKHYGKRCFILGSGPSIKDLDFSLLKDEYTFTVNQFARFENFEDLKTNYHIFADERIFKLDENKNSDKEALEYIKKLISSSKKIKFFSKLNSKEYIENSKYFKNIDVNYYTDGLSYYENYNLEPDISKQIPWFPTVIDYCIFIALYMGFKEIYLLGCDCTGFLRLATVDETQNADYQYGYKISKNEQERLNNQIKTYGIADELEVWGRIFRYYEWLSNYTKEYNATIINCTDRGILNIFERKSIKEVLKKKNN